MNPAKFAWGPTLWAGKAVLLSGTVLDGVEKTGQTAGIQQYLPPVDPPAVLCIGLNYRPHAEETGMPLPRYPVLFMKNPCVGDRPWAACGHSLILQQSSTGGL